MQELKGRTLWRATLLGVHSWQSADDVLTLGEKSRALSSTLPGWSAMLGVRSRMSAATIGGVVGGRGVEGAQPRVIILINILIGEHLQITVLVRYSSYRPSNEKPQVPSSTTSTLQCNCDSKFKIRVIYPFYSFYIDHSDHLHHSTAAVSSDRLTRKSRRKPDGNPELALRYFRVR